MTDIEKTPKVMLRKMTADEYLRFKGCSISDYAEDLIKGKGLNREQALAAAGKEYEEMLPFGLETEGHFLMSILDAENKEEVGSIWFFYDEKHGLKQVFLGDFLIYETERRKGYGAAALAEMERMAKTDGCTESVLYVWNHNPAGYSLYQKCGYVTITHEDGGSVMKKSL